jgi:molybdate transport system substrate-binding protein
VVLARSTCAFAVTCALAIIGGCGEGGATGADGSTGGGVSGDIVVFAAASLTDAFTEIGEAFTDEYPDASVTFSFAASSELAGQLIEGAPADVFASADLASMTRAVGADAIDGEPLTFATNRPTIVVAPGNPERIETLADLTDRGLIVVVCAPEVPCGSYATEAFDAADVEITPDSYEENVRAVVTKVALGEADAGIAYETDTASDDRIEGVPLPDEIDVVADYPIAVTADAPNPTAAAAFLDFTLGERGQANLAEHGFGAP